MEGWKKQPAEGWKDEKPLQVAGYGLKAGRMEGTPTIFRNQSANLPAIAVANHLVS
jgi:hypothetical protein